MDLAGQCLHRDVDEQLNHSMANQFYDGRGDWILVTGIAALLIGDLTDVDTIRAGAWMASTSFFVIVTSFGVAMMEGK
ncbi:hypothetical protein EMIT0P2_60015 [Pseudomonas sp. IT-P2]|uniref:hypothetical protein n=1 Tax=Pseudomonas sp. IT-P2 TaxID=3026456 RepID=UPI0039E0B4D0